MSIASSEGNETLSHFTPENNLHTKARRCDSKNSPSHDIHVTKLAIGGILSMTKMNWKMMIELAGGTQGPYELSNKSLSGFDQLSLLTN